MPGPPPKPAHLRQRTNRKPGAAALVALVRPPRHPIPNPDGRTWHRLTRRAWAHAWASPMASQWLTSDCDALGRLAVLWDEFYKAPATPLLAEIRLQEQRFGLSPLDRTRLQWEVARADAQDARPRARPVRTGPDPRAVLVAG
jgi:hypothetical protein